jgi:hypothetical protein
MSVVLFRFERGMLGFPHHRARSAPIIFALADTFGDGADGSARSCGWPQFALPCPAFFSWAELDELRTSRRRFLTALLHAATRTTR